jgi:hypothetical protein
VTVAVCDTGLGCGGSPVPLADGATLLLPDADGGGPSGCGGGDTFPSPKSGLVAGRADWDGMVVRVAVAEGDTGDGWVLASASIGSRVPDGDGGTVDAEALADCAGGAGDDDPEGVPGPEGVVVRVASGVVDSDADGMGVPGGDTSGRGDLDGSSAMAEGDG